MELRHTEVWSRAHLDWFNVDFDPSSYLSIPTSLSTLDEQAPKVKEQERPKKKDNSGNTDDKLLELLWAIANAYREYSNLEG